MPRNYRRRDHPNRGGSGLRPWEMDPFETEPYYKSTPRGEPFTRNYVLWQYRFSLNFGRIRLYQLIRDLSEPMSSPGAYLYRPDY